MISTEFTVKYNKKPVNISMSVKNPFIDFDHSYFVILARECEIGTFLEGLKMFRTVEALTQEWSQNQCRP